MVPMDVTELREGFEERASTKRTIENLVVNEKKWGPEDVVTCAWIGHGRDQRGAVP